jgi:hypothetical protein
MKFCIHLSNRLNLNPFVKTITFKLCRIWMKVMTNPAWRDLLKLSEQRQIPNIALRNSPDWIFSRRPIGGGTDDLGKNAWSMRDAECLTFWGSHLAFLHVSTSQNGPKHLHWLKSRAYDVLFVWLSCLESPCRSIEIIVSWSEYILRKCVD